MAPGRKCHEGLKIPAHFRPTQRPSQPCPTGVHTDARHTTRKVTEHAMTSKTTAEARREGKAESLAGRYGDIGISAVAAAVRYQSEAKNPAYAPVEPNAAVWLQEL